MKNAYVVIDDNKAELTGTLAGSRGQAWRKAAAVTGLNGLRLKTAGYKIIKYALKKAVAKELGKNKNG